MGLDRQLEQLAAVYSDKTDDELLALHEQRDDLTETAQQALQQVITNRRLSLAPPWFTRVEDNNHRTPSASPLTDNEVDLQTFDDAFRLNEALRLLTEAEIEHRVLNWYDVTPPTEGQRGPMVQIGLIVNKPDQARATQLLQSRMKLFPTSEGDYIPDETAEFTPLAVLTRDDALRVAQALGTEGISHIWTDGRDVATIEEDEVSFEVYTKNLPQAQLLLQKTLDS